MNRCLNDRAFGECVGTPEEIPVQPKFPWVAWADCTKDWDGNPLCKCAHNARTCPYYRDARESAIRQLEAK